MRKKERRKFDKAFKTMVVALQLRGKTSTEIGSKLGIGSDLVRRWTREFKSVGVKSFPGNGNMNLSPEQKEIYPLNKAIKASETEKEILKKAGSIRPFGDDSQERKNRYQFMKDHRKRLCC